MRFQAARAVADAVLFEGYALYPYRASSTKNRLRWQFGVLAPAPPPPPPRRAACEPWWCEMQCLVEKGVGGRIEGQARFLRVRRRSVEAPAGRPVESLDVDGQLLVAWDEGEPHDVSFSHALDGPADVILFALPGDEEHEEVCDRNRVSRARI